VTRPAVLALAATLAFLVPVESSAQSLPALTGPVNDFAKVIDSTSAGELDRRIRALQAASGDVVVVATIDSIAPYATIEEYAVALFKRAGIGASDKDNGVLILLAVADRRVKVEVGYGVEEFITDGFAGETIRQEMLPSFREGRFGPGLLAGATRIVQRIADRRGVTLTNVPRPAGGPVKRPSGSSLVVALVIFIIVMNIIKRSGGGPRFRGPRRSTWSGWHGGIGGFGGGFGGFGGGGFGGGFGGGGGGGFGGFGGGGSGGGGASGRW